MLDMCAVFFLTFSAHSGIPILPLRVGGMYGRGGVDSQVLLLGAGAMYGRGEERKKKEFVKICAEI